MTEYRPANGSCVRCRGALGLASVREGDRWYCSPACADGEAPNPEVRRVPESRLYGVHRRFFRKRAPKELRSS